MYIYSGILAVLPFLQMLFGNKKNGRKYMAMLLGCMMIGLSAVRAETVGTDLAVYLERFDIIAESSWRGLRELVSDVDFEYGFIVFCKAISGICFSHRFFIIVTSIIIQGGWQLFFYKNSEDICMSNLLYVTLNIFFGTLNIVRQALATVIIYHSISFLKRKEYKRFICFVCLAGLLHFPAFIWLILPFIYRIRLRFVSLIPYAAGLMLMPMAVCGIFCRVLPGTKYETYLSFIGQGSGYLKILEILIILTVVALYYKKSCDQDDVYIHVFLIALSLNLLSLRMAIAGRLLDYFFPAAVIILPNALKRIEEKRDRVFLYMAIILLSALRFIRYCQVDLGKVVPYVFMWKS